MPQTSARFLPDLYHKEVGEVLQIVRQLYIDRIAASNAAV